MCRLFLLFFFFFFNDTATTEIYTLSLHDALPILMQTRVTRSIGPDRRGLGLVRFAEPDLVLDLLERSEEHTSELQSQFHLVCRLLLEKKKKKKQFYTQPL